MILSEAFLAKALFATVSGEKSYKICGIAFPYYSCFILISFLTEIKNADIFSTEKLRNV